jgi:transposase
LTGELSYKDEARVSQNNGLVRQWARRGTRPRQPADQRYDSAYLFGAIGPPAASARRWRFLMPTPRRCSFISMRSRATVAAGAHVVLIFDRAGWHTSGKLDMPDNITPIWLPSRAPELNPVENVCQYLRANWLANTVFETFDDIIEPICHASNQFTAQPETIASIGRRDWAHVGQPL